MQIDNIKKECNLKNISVAKMLKDLELSVNVLNRWENGTDPKISSLIKIADYLETSIDYIIGREEPNEKKSNNYTQCYDFNKVNNSNSLKPLEVELLNIFNQLSKIEQLDLLKEIEEKRNK